MSLFRLPLFFCLSLLLCAPACQARPREPQAVPVLTGLDVLEAGSFQALSGKRVGLVTNHTGRDRRGRSIVDLLSAAPGVKLAALFAPEHGLWGKLDREYGDSSTAQGGLPVYSLYGKTRKPEPRWLEGLDILVFDIQDIGTRFYTYSTTLALCMQAAAEAGLAVTVLDRPNPIGGLAVEGPVLEKALCGNFIAYYPIPVRHGLTLGELAGLYNAEFGIGAKLSVVKMQGWRRGMLWDDTGCNWINPSPNMRSPMAALLYPGLGIAEATNLSVGRGTEAPFELYGAPWITRPGLADSLNAAGVDGVSFRDTTFTPADYVFKGQACRGVRATVTGPQRLESLKAGLLLLAVIERLYPEKFELNKIDLWIGRQDVKERLRRGEAVESIMQSWQPELERFKATRLRYLLYPD
ncbi:DUF1343 domain-containing protein [bacterium]|nr:DUF1343 domain-containing protein [bacterium]